MSEEAKAMTDHSTDRSTNRIKNTIKKRPETPPPAEFIGNDSLPVSRENTPGLPGEAALYDWLSRGRLGRTSTQLSEHKLAILASQKAPKSILGRAQKKQSYASGVIPTHQIKTTCSESSSEVSSDKSKKGGSIHELYSTS